MRKSRRLKKQKKNIKKRKYSKDRHKLRKWANLIKKRDNYICFMCGAKGVKAGIEAHHIYPKGNPKYKDRIYLLSNGISLCDRCHLIVHSTKKNWHKFTPMFNQYMERKRVFLYNNELKIEKYGEK